METVTDFLREAARILRKRASEATPGPWERPLDVRNKSIVLAALPDDERPRSYLDGTIPAEFHDMPGPLGRYAGQRERTSVVAAENDRTRGFTRPRSGRDLEYIALMDPEVGLLVAEWLDYHATIREQGRYAQGAPGDKQALSLAEKILDRERETT